MKVGNHSKKYLHDKVVVVTGGTDGIGRALVEQLLDMGARVATCGRKADKLQQLSVRHFGKPLLVMAADVSIEEDCDKFIRQTLDHFGGIDVLVNNAGISMRAEFNEVSMRTIKRVMTTNFMGSVYMTHFALPAILQSKGDVVVVSSVAGFRGLPGRTGYAASKWALQGWVESLRTELLESGVNVMTVCPGFTATNIRRVALNKDAAAVGENFISEKKMMTAEECAIKILGAVAHRQRSPVFTFNDWITLWVNKLFPNLADRLTRKFYYSNGRLIK